MNVARALARPRAVRRAFSTASAVKDLVIIGSGPAGYTAGIYAARAMLQPTIFAGYAQGGQLMLTTEVENFPGSMGLLGPEIMGKLKGQAEAFGAEVHDWPL